jgi:hypothetical protein
MIYLRAMHSRPIVSPPLTLSSHRPLASNRWRGHAHSAPGPLASPTANSYPGTPPVSRPYASTTAGPSNVPRYDPFASRNPALPITAPTPHATAPAPVPRPGRHPTSPFENAIAYTLSSHPIQIFPILSSRSDCIKHRGVSWYAVIA